MPRVEREKEVPDLMANMKNGEECLRSVWCGRTYQQDDDEDIRNRCVVSDSLDSKTTLTRTKYSFRAIPPCLLISYTQAMEKKAQQLLKDFATVCSAVTLRPDDWPRLYALTVHVHRQHLHIDHRTVRDYLVSHGCSLQKASWLSAQYQHFIELLAWYDQQKQS